MENSILISVIIGFKDWGLDRISGAVRSIQDSLAGIPSEVIITDYGSVNSEGYREALEGLGARYRYVKTDGTWSRSRALNAGLQIAEGRYLVTTDADMVFSPTTFPRLVELLSGDPYTSYLLQCRDLPEGINHDDILDADLDWDWLDGNSRLRPRWGMGGMIAFDRNAYETIRGLDERMQIYGGEDIDLAKRLLRVGHKRMWIDDPAVRMYHVWHPSSRASADETVEGRRAIQLNRDIHLNDRSVVRNLKEWTGRPDSSRPLVTVAISTFNRAEYLEDSINSVLGQTFQDWELVIVNDGSTDNTLEVLSQFQDPRIRVISQENRGLAAARNRITAEAKGKYIAVHDDDDIMLPWSLEMRIQSIADGAHGSYGGWVDFNNQTGERHYNIGKKLSIDSLLFNRSTYLHPTLLVETKVLKAIPYNETMRSGSDFNLAVRMVRAGIKLVHSSHYVLLRRLHEGQITNSDSTLQKVSGFLTNFMARGTMTPSDISEMRQGRHEKDKAVISVSQAQAEPFIVPFMPDHLVRRSAAIEFDLSADGGDKQLYSLPVSSFWRVEGEQSFEVNVKFFDIELRELFDLYRRHGDQLKLRATARSIEVEDILYLEVDEREAVVAEPRFSLETWLVGHLEASPAGFYFAFEDNQVDVSHLLAAGGHSESSEENCALVGYKDGNKIYRASSLRDVSAFLEKAGSSRQQSFPRHIIIEKEV